MELRSRVLAETETGDSGPGVSGPQSLLAEGSGGQSLTVLWVIALLPKKPGQVFHTQAQRG